MEIRVVWVIDSDGARKYFVDLIGEDGPIAHRGPFSRWQDAVDYGNTCEKLALAEGLPVSWNMRGCADSI